MRDIVKEYQKKFRRNHQRARRYTALLLALALTKPVESGGVRLRDGPQAL